MKVTDGADRLATDLSGNHTIRFTANPIQRAFIESRAEADLWAARKGEGKSTGLVWGCFHHQQQNPAAYDIVVRDTFVNLENTTMVEFFKWFPPGIAGTYNAGRRMWKWNAGEMRGQIGFIGLDSAEDSNKIASRPLGGAFFDEVAPAIAESGGIDRENFVAVQNQLRQSGVDWYACKIAENAPDESHWTYEDFVDPGTDGYAYWRSQAPENTGHLPANYYAAMRRRYERLGRMDLVKRMVEGDWGFQSLGKQVTPEFDERLHLATGLYPVDGPTLYLWWDFGHNPTCLITQITPMGRWQFLESHVGEATGTMQLIEGLIAPALRTTYKGFKWEHGGDRTGQTADPSDIRNSPVKVIQRMLGGRFHPGPESIASRVEPLRAVLTRTVEGRGVVQIDRHKAREVWHALRGGWHRKVNKSGLPGEIEKNEYSHPGDAAGYGAAYLFPLTGLLQRPGGGVSHAQAHGVSYQGRRRGDIRGTQMPKPPRHGAPMR